MDQSRKWPLSKILLGVGGLALIVIAVTAVGALTNTEPDGPVPPPAALEVPDPRSVYDPVKAGETTPRGYRQIIDRDHIAPVYNPAFTSADDVDWPDDSLVVAVAGDETAKAYPVTHLNSREMVIDDIEGIPILVTW